MDEQMHIRIDDALPISGVGRVIFHSSAAKISADASRTSLINHTVGLGVPACPKKAGRQTGRRMGKRGPQPQKATAPPPPPNRRRKAKAA